MCAVKRIGMHAARTTVGGSFVVGRAAARVGYKSQGWLVDCSLFGKCDQHVIAELPDISRSHCSFADVSHANHRGHMQYIIHNCLTHGSIIYNGLYVTPVIYMVESICTVCVLPPCTRQILAQQDHLDGHCCKAVERSSTATLCRKASQRPSFQVHAESISDTHPRHPSAPSR